MAWSSSSPRKKNWNLAPVIPRTSWCFSAKKVSPVAFDEKQDILLQNAAERNEVPGMEKNVKIRHLSSSLYFGPEFPFAIAKYNHTKAQFERNPPSVRDFWKITLVKGGKGTLEFCGRNFPLAEGSIYLMHPDFLTNYKVTEEPLIVCNILFSRDFLGSELESLMRRSAFFRMFSDSPLEEEIPFYAYRASRLLRSIVSELEQEYFRKEVNYQWDIRINLLHLLIHIQRIRDAEEPDSAHEQVVAAIRKMVETDFRRPFQLPELAKQFGLSRQHLCHIYKKSTERTIIEDVNEHRLDYAAELLLNSSRQISEICYECGFNDLSYFYRIFKQRFGRNPGSFRKIVHE